MMEYINVVITYANEIASLLYNNINLIIIL